MSPVLGTSLSDWVGFESEVQKPVDVVKASEEGIVNKLSSIEDIGVFQVQSGTRDFGVGTPPLVPSVQFWPDPPCPGGATY